MKVVSGIRKNVKLAQLLKPNMKVLLEFGHIPHGMGDCIMFRSVYQELKKLFPQTVFNLHCRSGQDIFNQITEKDYDLLFQVTMAQNNGGQSKFRICAEQEFGIPWNSANQFSWKLPEVHTDIVLPANVMGLSFQSTSDPAKNLPADKARTIWNLVKDVGFIPLEVHFEHNYKKPVNTRYSFIDYSCRDFPASVENCIGVMQQCKGFIGISTGTSCIAASLYPMKTMHLNTKNYWVPKIQTDGFFWQLDCRRSLLNTKAIKDFLNVCR